MKKIAWFLCLLAACFSIAACSHSSGTGSTGGGGGSGTGDNIGGTGGNSGGTGGNVGNGGGNSGGTGVEYDPPQKRDDTLYIHYLRDEADYDDWHVWSWGQGNGGTWYESVDTDSSGAIFAIPFDDYDGTVTQVNFIVAKGDWLAKDVPNNCLVKLSEASKVDNSYHWYVEQGKSDMGSGTFGTSQNVEHTHTFDTANWITDVNYHWHAATCEHETLTQDKATHNFDGNRCTVCQYTLQQGSGDVSIVFDAGEGAFSSGQSSISIRPDTDGKVDIYESPLRDGCAFAGWYNGNNVKFDSNTSYSVSQTFTARYMAGSGNGVYTALFDTDSNVSIKIDMSDAEWTKLNNDFYNNSKSPIYRKADSVTIGITTDEGRLDYYYEEVGVRLKGNTSRHSFYDNGFYQSAHFKLSFGETFDSADEYSASEIKTWSDSAARKARKKRTFATMEKIDVKYNATKDESYVRELYALKLFRDNGVVAPQGTLCALTARNKDRDFINLGVYRVLEPVDSVFIKRHFPDDSTGDLYKCTWSGSYGSDFTTTVNGDGNSLIGVEDELARKFYTYDKKTNKKVYDLGGNVDIASMRDFIGAVGSADANRLAQLVDIDYFAKFEAVNYILGNPDCIRNNKNNFYTYFRPSDGKAIFIPFDYDRCLGITYQWNPTGNACTELNPYDTRTAAYGDQVNPIYIKLIDKGAPYGQGSALMKYRDNLVAIKGISSLTASAFEAYKDMYKNKYADVASSAVRFTGDNIISNDLQFDRNYGGNMSYSEYIGKKLNTLNNNIDNYR